MWLENKRISSIMMRSLHIISIAEFEILTELRVSLNNIVQSSSKKFIIAVLNADAFLSPKGITLNVLFFH